MKMVFNNTATSGRYSDIIYTSYSNTHLKHLNSSVQSQNPVKARRKHLIQHLNNIINLAKTDYSTNLTSNTPRKCTLLLDTYNPHWKSFPPLKPSKAASY